jgi:hypothetical protein
VRYLAIGLANSEDEIRWIMTFGARVLFSVKERGTILLGIWVRFHDY